jgi:hypothetical protein
MTPSITLESLADRFPDQDQPPLRAQEKPETAERTGPLWGRELPSRFRQSEDFRVAIWRGEDGDYRVVEMVREGSGWRERELQAPEGFEVAGARMMDAVVDGMTP